MSILSTQIYGSTTSKGVGGLVSGIDTDDLVTQMLSGTKSKINREYQLQQKLVYRQDAYREVSTKLLSFSDKYFSYSSGSDTNILKSNFFESYTYESSSSYVDVTGDADNISNFSIDSISSVATSASFTSTKKVTSGEFESEKLTYYTSTLAGATMTIEYDDKTYNLQIDKGFGNNNTGSVSLSSVIDELNEQISKISGLSDVTVSENPDNSNGIAIRSSDTAKDVKLTAASNVIIDNLNMEVGEIASSGDINVDNLVKETTSILQDEDEYITFNYNGVQKTINFGSDVTKPNLATYLQDKLDDAYGEGKTFVKYDDITKKITFSAVEDTEDDSEQNDTNIFGISSISSELSNFTGLEAGDYNRVNVAKSLNELGLEGLEEKDTYEISVNGESIEIENTMSVTEIIDKINSNEEAGVKVYYSSTTNTFTVKATETGINSGVSIVDSDGGGNLAATLFGTGVKLEDKLNEGEYIKTVDGEDYIYKLEGETETMVAKVTLVEETDKYKIDYVDESVSDISDIDYIIKPGTDTEMTYTLNGVQNTVTRSTANFSIDEINIELDEKAADTATTDTPITFDVTNNSDEIVEKFKEFIDSYNEIVTLISTETSEKPDSDYAPLTPDQMDEMEADEIEEWEEQARKGILFADSRMNTVLNDMREIMYSTTSGSSFTLSSIGITTSSYDTSGKLILDEAKFKEQLLADPDEISNLFSYTETDTSSASKSGIAVQLKDVLLENVGTSGTTGYLIDEAGLDSGISSDQNYITSRIEEYDDKMEELREDMEDERERYWSKFSAMETALSTLNSQSSWFTDMLG